MATFGCRLSRPKTFLPQPPWPMRVLACLTMKNIQCHTYSQIRWCSKCQQLLPHLSVTIDWHQLPSTLLQYFVLLKRHLIIQFLSSIGISGTLYTFLVWLLTDRKQRVVLVEASSHFTPVISGFNTWSPTFYLHKFHQIAPNFTWLETHATCSLHIKSPEDVYVRH